jgi:hypothetical protein
MMTDPVWKPVYRYVSESNRKASSQGGGAAAGAPSGGGLPGEAQQHQPKKSIKKVNFFEHWIHSQRACECGQDPVVSRDERGCVHFYSPVVQM